MKLTIDEKFALLQDMKVIDNNRKIVKRLKKRIEECKTNSNKLSIKTQWSEYVLQERVGKELQKVLGEKKDD